MYNNATAQTVGGVQGGYVPVPAQSQRQTIQGEIDRLNGAMGSLFSAINDLDGRLQPVMESIPSGNVSATPPAPEPMNIAHRVALAVDAVNRAGQRIAELTARIQL